MKYLKIHKLIWLILVIVFTLIDAVITYICMFIYILWNFKIPEDWWKEEHTRNEEDIWDNEEYIVYSDNNIFETIKRRYDAWEVWKNMQ